MTEVRVVGSQREGRLDDARGRIGPYRRGDKMKTKMKMKSWMARALAVSILLAAFGMISGAQEEAAAPPVEVNVSAEKITGDVAMVVVPLTNTRQVLALSGTDPSIFEGGLFTKSAAGYVSNPAYTMSMNAFLSGNETATYPTRKLATIGLVHLAANG